MSYEWVINIAKYICTYTYVEWQEERQYVAVRTWVKGLFTRWIYTCMYVLSMCPRVSHTHILRSTKCARDLRRPRPSRTIGSRSYMSTLYIAHAATIARDARILSALVTRDASGTIFSRLSCSSFGTSPGSVSFFLFLSHSISSLFSQRSTRRIMCERA